ICEMPTFLGAGSEFIVDKRITHYKNEVLQLDQITKDTTLVGYIYGGISSSAANIFFINNGTQSSASNQIFKVYLIKKSLSTHYLNEQSIGTLRLQVYPNPNLGNFLVKFNLAKNSDIRITIYGMNGELFEEKILKNMHLGENIYEPILNMRSVTGTFFVTIETNHEKATQKIVIKQ
ncbi:MAG TPA: T9SS type A sorting domain-containing protein, partial [Saprospiraceae bacterium]|nr:T9SS type A sorting domain-containing protein [Saprospiraceae bacterium]